MSFSVGPQNGDEGGEDVLPEVNVTPLVDIMLVLLIIFMVTSSVMSNSGVEVKLPQASNQTSSAQPEGVLVTLLPDGRLKINGESISGDAFDARMKQLLAASSQKLVILEGDRQAFLGKAVEVMDRSKRAGAERFAIATESERSQPQTPNRERR